MVAAFATDRTKIAPVSSNSALLTLKNKIVDLIKQNNEKTIESPQPYINIAKNFQMLNEICAND